MWTSGRRLVRLEVIGRPAVFATASQRDWKAAVAKAVSQSAVRPASRWFAVRMLFHTPAPRNANEKWDIDNLVKPTLDAMDGVFGLGEWKGQRQPADDRVDRIEAEKRQVAAGESVGATIDVWIVDEDTESAEEQCNIDADPINADWIKIVARIKRAGPSIPN